MSRRLAFAFSAALVAACGPPAPPRTGPAAAPPAAELLAPLPPCAGLGRADRARTLRLLGQIYPHDCCDESLARCLQASTRCGLVERLASNVCRRVAAGQQRQQILRAMARRADAMLTLTLAPSPPRTLDLRGAEAAGDPAAPITVVEFADARGPSCARVTPGLHRAVVQGPLRGKVKLYFKLFPMRRNSHSREAALAVLAAGEQGGYWRYLLHGYQRFDAYRPDVQQAWARVLGLDAQRFARKLQDPQLLKGLKRSKLEGLENGVNSTPTFFIDGQPYRGELSVEELVDVLEELSPLRRGGAARASAPGER
jgi:protein-disulfide isomerase